MGKDKGGKGGVVVNISSIAGLAPYAGCPVYVATKHAVIGLTRSFGVSTAYIGVLTFLCHGPLSKPVETYGPLLKNVFKCIKQNT